MQLAEFMKEYVFLYREIFGADLLRYVLGAGGVYLVINRLLQRRLAGQKIRAGDPPRGQIFREIMASLRTVAIFAATGTCIALGARAEVMTIYPAIADFGWAYFTFSIIALIVLHDTWFYWSHRALHYPPLFRRFHRLHHRSHQPTPFTSYSFDIGEAVVNALYLPLILLLIPAHPVALFIFVTHMMLRNALGHCGTEVFPARANGKPVFGWLSSVTHHDLHHAQAGYNLGLYFTWWDRWMGTEHPAYLKAFAQSAPRMRPARMGMSLVLAILITKVWAGSVEAQELRGTYASPGLGVIVRFDACASDPVLRCGKVVWVWDLADTPHTPPGTTILHDLQFDGRHWHGRLTRPENGRIYTGRLRQLSDNRLELKGCAGPICARQIWHNTNALAKALRNLR